jgi:Recombinational DNA repair ATPase (RecF pathway)
LIKKINCFVGPNGIGKTNVLDAIYHLSFGKSYFNPISTQNIRHNQDFFVIDGLYNKTEKEEKNCCITKKKVKKNSLKETERFMSVLATI